MKKRIKYSYNWSCNLLKSVNLFQAYTTHNSSLITQKVETQAYFENIQSEIHRRLTAAESQIDLAVAWFTDRVLFDVVCQKARNGVKVRLLLFDDDINKHLAINKLETCGGRVFRIAEKLMHNKFCVIDRDIVISGSYNWTNKAANALNYENISITTGDPLYADQFVQEISRIVELHFGEKHDTTTDFSQIEKRLTLIRQLIELGDTDDLPPQYRKLKTRNCPTRLPRFCPYSMPDTTAVRCRK